MAHYFKFHALSDLDAEAQRLGLDLRFSADLAPLFAPANIGPLVVGNRLCVQPMEGCDGTLDGRPDELTLRRYQRFGAGGAKLIWAEATAVVEEARANPRQLLIDERTAADLAQMLQVCRQAHREACGRDDDLVVGLQLTHSGRYSYRRPLLAVHDPLLDPRTVADRATGRAVDAAYPLLSDDELHRLVDAYVAAARLAHRIGYQFVDVKQCHRYLLNELLAAQERPGPYGGSLENRTRLARAIIGAIRAEVPGLVIASRINVYDAIPYSKSGGDVGEPCPYETPLRCAWGTDPLDPLRPDLTEPLAWIAEMARLGVALVNVSMGSPYATPHVTRPFEYPPPDGYDTPEPPLAGVDRHFRLAAQVQEAVGGLPVVGSGYSYLQEFFPHAGAANVRDGRCTFVGVGRATLAQPDFVRQLEAHGKLDRKRLCRTFSYCTALMRSKHNELGQFATGCPPFDKEVYGPIWQRRRKAPGARVAQRRTRIRACFSARAETTMASPFPGINPYIEACGLWEDFHAKLIGEIERALAPVLPERYVVRAGERSYVVLAPSAQAAEYAMLPDIAVITRRRAKHRKKPAGGTAIAERPVNGPLAMRALVETEFRETFLEIRELNPHHRLITVIEVLSPSNKREDSPGWAQYLRKRQALLAGQAHLVKIDLLRGGQRLPMEDDWPDSPYYLLVAQGGVAPAHGLAGALSAPAPGDPSAAGTPGSGCSLIAATAGRRSVRAIAL